MQLRQLRRATRLVGGDGDIMMKIIEREEAKFRSKSSSRMTVDYCTG
jgi:hypothetical protein